MHRLKFTVLLFLPLVLFATFSTNVKAACFNAPLDGIWVNNEANTKDLVKVHIVHQCTQEETTDGLIVPGSQWFVRVWAKCYPANCAWGRTRARIGPKGNLRASLTTYAADRFLSVRMDGAKIRVHLIINYHDSRRKDRDETVLLTRQ